jgi:hypothetical protein
MDKIKIAIRKFKNTFLSKKTQKKSKAEINSSKAKLTGDFCKF